MRNSKNGDVWEAMNIYNEGVAEGSINGSNEFLAHFGDRDPELGMKVIKEDLDTETKGTAKLNGDVEMIAQRKEEFLNYLSNESGISCE